MYVCIYDIICIKLFIFFANLSFLKKFCHNMCQFESQHSRSAGNYWPTHMHHLLGLEKFQQSRQHTNDHIVVCSRLCMLYTVLAQHKHRNRQCKSLFCNHSFSIQNVSLEYTLDITAANNLQVLPYRGCCGLQAVFLLVKHFCLRKRVVDMLTLQLIFLLILSLFFFAGDLFSSSGPYIRTFTSLGYIISTGSLRKAFKR